MRRSTSSWAQVIQNRLIAAVLAMIVVVPFVATAADSNTRGLAAFAFETFGILLLAMLIWKARWNFTRESVGNFLRTGGNLPVLLFAALATLSFAVSPYKDYSGQELLRLLSGVMLYFVVAYQFRRSEQLAKLTDILMFVAIGSSFIGFIQYGLSPEEQHYASGLFGDHQLYGSFMMVLLPFVAVTALTERQPNRQLVAQIATVVSIAALLLSFSRSAWIGGAAGLGGLGLLMLYMATRKNAVNTKKHEIALPVMLLLVSVGFFLLMSPQTNQQAAARAGSLMQPSAERGWQYRQQAWRGAEAMIKARPLTGWGIGNYPVLQQQYTSSGLPGSLFTSSAIKARPSLGEQAHNFYLQTAAEIGIPGLLLFIAALSAFLGMGLQRVITMEAGIRRALLLGSMAAVVSFAVDAFGSPAWQFGQISMFFWLAMGIGTSCMRQRSRHHVRVPEEVPTTGGLRVSRYGAVFATVALALLLPTVSLAGVPSYLIPKSADIEPKNASIASGASQAYTLYVTFTDPTSNPPNQLVTYDVTTQPPTYNANGTVITQTNFTQTGGDGTMTGTNNHIYQSRSRENDRPQITGTYLQNGITVSDTTGLTVGTP